VTIQIDRLSKYHVIASLILAADMQIIAACVLDRHGPERVRDKRGHRIYAGENMRAGYQHLCDALDRLAKAMGV